MKPRGSGLGNAIKLGSMSDGGEVFPTGCASCTLGAEGLIRVIVSAISVAPLGLK